MLNDFDLASVMPPGAESPPKVGHRRTGTLVFMALDLLQKLNGEISRCYRHEVESFVWVLLWAGLSSQPCNERYILDWVTLDPRSIFEKKTAMLRSIKDSLDPIKQSPYYRVLYNSLVMLKKMDANSTPYLDEDDKTPPSDDDLLALLVTAFEMPGNSQWMNVKVSPVFFTFFTYTDPALNSTNPKVDE